MLGTQSAHRHDSSCDNSKLTLADSPVSYIVVSCQTRAPTTDHWPLKTASKTVGLLL